GVAAVHSAGEPDGDYSRAGVAHGERGGAAWFCAGDLYLRPLSRGSREWLRVHQAVSWTGVVALSSAATDRDYLALCSCAFTHGPSLRQHVRRRSRDAGVLLAGADRDSADLSRSAPWRGRRPGLCVLSAGFDLSVTGGCARTLMLRIT